VLAFANFIHCAEATSAQKASNSAGRQLFATGTYRAIVVTGITHFVNLPLLCHWLVGLISSFNTDAYRIADALFCGYAQLAFTILAGGMLWHLKILESSGPCIRCVEIF
jgi:hypothetical protein